MDYMADDLIEFYGTECVHCKQMEPLMEKLKKETGLLITRLEVWHNQKNAQLMMELSKGECMSIPFFYNRKTGKSICGNTDYDTLKKWALGK